MKNQYAIYPSLVNRRIYITGGASGIGLSLVECFARQNAQVAFLDNNKKAGTELSKKLNDQGFKVYFEYCDLRNILALKKTFDSFRNKIGAAEVLCNNVANDERHEWNSVTPEYWDNNIAVNLKHIFFAIQYVSPYMIKANAGSIMNMGSAAWMVKAGDMPCYTTAKAGVEGLTRSFARDLGANNIRVNSLVPGWIMTDRQLSLWVDDKTKEEIKAKQTLSKVLVYPDDVARLALFLAADDSEKMSGHSYVIDGGWS